MYLLKARCGSGPKNGSIMTIPFDIFYQRVLKTTDITTQMALAEALGVNRSAITQAKTRDAVPVKWILSLSRRYTLSPDWLEFGTGSPRPPVEARETSLDSGKAEARLKDAMQKPATSGAAVLESDSYMDAARVNSMNGTRDRTEARPERRGNSPRPDMEMVFVPKVHARLCAGGGSFEIEAVPVSEHPFPYQWLARMGSPNSMVFMDVVGSSMEPGILDGDMVLVDQSATQISPHSVLAVGYEDSIYLKRVEKRDGGIILHSDNPAYSDMEIAGDELNSFRIIGKIVWLCRDCRYY
jgi:phage repressor protein C with HTH and peptisase S24 domain